MAYVIPDPLIIHTVEGEDGGLSLLSPDGTTSISIQNGGVQLQAPYFFSVSGPHISLNVGGQTAWEATYESFVTKMAFFGAEPIARPSVTGVTTQDQVDALVDALVGLGLVTDDR